MVADHTYLVSCPPIIHFLSQDLSQISARLVNNLHETGYQNFEPWNLFRVSYCYFFAKCLRTNIVSKTYWYEGVTLSLLLELSE